MQLDRIPPRRPALAVACPGPALQVSGTAAALGGVWLDDRPGEEGVPVARGRRVRPASWLLVAWAAASLLGQGERSQPDPRFLSPSATLVTYWEALRDNDAETVSECMLEPGAAGQPFPGMLWFMPPTREVRLDAFHSLPVTGGHLLVSYEVRFRPVGTDQWQRFETGNELVRRHGEWRIAHGIGSAGLPEWHPIPRAVDI